MAPLLMGDAARALFKMPAFTHLADCMALDISDVRAVGKDWRLRARIRNA